MAADLTENVEREGVPPQAWWILLLCGLAGLLFYLDRQALAVLKTTLKSELGWSDVAYGWLVTAFMACYTICYVFSGRWVDRFGARRMMPLFIGLMSLATLGCGFSRGIGEMGICRGLLGVAEAGIVPAVLVTIFSWFPASRRGTASAIREPINIAGQVLAVPVTVACTQAWGWPSAFFAPGLAGLLLAVLWWRMDAPPARHRPRCGGGGSRECGRPQESYLSLLRRREIWGVIGARMVSDPVYFFLLYWEPGFLQERVGFSLGELGRLGWIPTAVATLVLMALGVFSDRLIARSGWAPPRSRRVVLQAMTALAPAVLFLPFVRSHLLAIGLLCLARTMMLVWLNFSTLLMADLVPRQLIGTSVALMSAFGAAMSVLCNLTVGPAISAFGYVAVFAVGAGLYPLAAVILWFAYGRNAFAPAGSRLVA